MIKNFGFEPTCMLEQHVKFRNQQPFLPFYFQANCTSNLMHLTSIICYALCPRKTPCPSILELFITFIILLFKFTIEVWQTWWTSYEVGFETKVIMRGFEVDVIIKGYDVDATTIGFEVIIMTRGFRSNIFTSTISTFVVRRKMGLNLKFKITRGGMVELGNKKLKKDEQEST